MGEVFITRRGGGVKDTSLIGIEITTPPNRTVYYSDDKFDPAGMVIVARYADGKEFPVNWFTYSTNPLTSGQAFVTILYTERDTTVTADQAITVKPMSKILENNSWDIIRMVSADGLASTYWKIGDTKTEILNGIIYTFEIIGFDHDNLNSADTQYNNPTYNNGKNKAGITFCMKGLVAGTGRMAYSNDNTVGWVDSYMRLYSIPTIKGYMPASLQSVLRKVSKLTSAGNKSTTIITSVDELFLLSEKEIVGFRVYSYDGEGNQYPYFSAGNSAMKKLNPGDSNGQMWWLRSPYGTATTEYCAIRYDGSHYFNTANNYNYIVVGFCV